MLDLLTKGRIMSKQTKMADAIVAAITSGKVPKTSDGKNPIAKAMGRLGGLKGGHARAASMTTKERSDSARKAARVRWGNRCFQIPQIRNPDGSMKHIHQDGSRFHV